jgi:ferritin-like metal-binding protein YciE
MDLKNLQDLFLHDLKDTYDAEKRMTKSLPKLAKAASSPKLQAAFRKHLTQTETHVGRLERIFKLLGVPARGKKCPGMVGLIEEGSELMQEDGNEATLDAGLIGAAQKVEHYEIAAYGTLVTYAQILGLNEAEKLLKQTLGEEKQTDEELTEIARTINFESEEEPDGEENNAAKGVRRRAGPKGESNGRKKGNRGSMFGRMGKALSGFVSSS